MHLNMDNWKELFNWGKLAGNGQMDRRFMFLEKFWPQVGCLPLPEGYIHVYFHNIQNSSSLKQLDHSKPNFGWSILGKSE